VTEARQCRLRQLGLLAQSVELIAARRRRENDDAARAIGDRGGQRVEADLGDLIDRERKNPRRQAAPVARHGADQAVAMVSVVDQQHRIHAAGRSIGAQQRAQPPIQNIAGGHCIGSRSGRAYAGAPAAPGAEMVVEGHDIAGRRYRRCRTDIDTAAAADHRVARMGADIFIVIDIDRLIEFADQIGGVEQRPLNLGRAGRVGAQIAVALFRRRNQRRPARDIDDQIEIQRHAVAAGLKFQRGPGFGPRAREPVDLDREPAEVTG